MHQQFAFLAPTPVSWAVGHSHFQISTLSVSLDPNGAFVDHGISYIYFLKGMSKSYARLIYVMVIFKCNIPQYMVPSCWCSVALTNAVQH